MKSLAQDHTAREQLGGLKLKSPVPETRVLRVPSPPLQEAFEWQV